MVTIMILIVFFGKKGDFLIYLALFYPTRMISMNFGYWPIPDFQTFRYPGFPSLFVPYEQTNDFFFSGHTGLCTIVCTYLILTYPNNKLWMTYGFFLVLFTVYMLIVTRSHYFNDIIYGFLIGLTGTYYGHRYKYFIQYYFIVGYCKLLSLIVKNNENENIDNKNEKLISEQETIIVN